MGNFYQKYLKGVTNRQCTNNKGFDNLIFNLILF